MAITAGRLIVVWVLVWAVGGIKIVPDGYQRHLPPREPGDGPVDVALNLKINGISEVNLEEMSLLFELYFRVSWQDPRLIFPGQEYSNATSKPPQPTSKPPQPTFKPPQPTSRPPQSTSPTALSSSSSTLSPSPSSPTSSTSPSLSATTASSPEVTGITTSSELIKKVWTPDVFIQGTRDIGTFTLFQKFQGVVLYRDSTVLTSTMMQLKLGCSMTFHNYPFDIQSCIIHISSYMYNRREVTFAWMPPGLSTDAEISKQLASYDYSLTRLNETLCHCLTCVPVYSPCLRVLLVLRRHSFIHVMGEYVPSSLFVLVGWASFFWPAEVVPGRTVLVITALLTIATMYSDIRQTSPTTSYVKAIDVWLFMCILLTTLPLLQYAVVLTWRKKQAASKVHHVSPMDKRQVKDSKMSDTYVLYERRTEWAGRIGVPLCFFIFNLVYWPTYLSG